MIRSTATELVQILQSDDKWSWYCTQSPDGAMERGRDPLSICNRSFWTKWRLLLAQLPGYHFGGTMGLVRSSCKSMSIRLFWNITMWKIETPWVSPLPWAPLKSGGRYDKTTHRGLLRLMSHWRPSSFRLQLYPSWTLLLWRPYKSWCLAK